MALATSSFPPDVRMKISWIPRDVCNTPLNPAGTSAWSLKSPAARPRPIDFPPKDRPMTTAVTPGILSSLAMVLLPSLSVDWCRPRRCPDISRSSGSKSPATYIRCIGRPDGCHKAAAPYINLRCLAKGELTQYHRKYKSLCVTAWNGGGQTER